MSLNIMAWWTARSRGHLRIAVQLSGATAPLALAAATAPCIRIVPS
jgi:hypothetical protein